MVAACRGGQGEARVSPPVGYDSGAEDTGESGSHTGESGSDSDESGTPPTSWSIVPGSTRKIVQLTGDDDRERGTPTPNQTGARFGLWGTDLGASFPHEGRTWYLFGDSIPVGGGHPTCGDSLAWSEDDDAADGIDLTFLVNSSGEYRSPAVEGVSLGCYEVPLDGVSVGGAMYVWFSTDTMTRSVLARSENDGATFAFVRAWSDEWFVNVSVDLVPGGAAWPDEAAERIVLFGSGPYRASNPYLATVPVDEVEDAAAVRYFAGLDGGTPQWASTERDAMPLFESPCLGELSAGWDEALGRWVLLYNCGVPRGIVLRTAPEPWGPWTDAALAFEPWGDGGYCHFLHTAWHYDVCDSVHDAGRENEWGGEYGPYAVPALTERVGDDATIYYVMSTWNPYNTVVVATDLVADG